MSTDPEAAKRVATAVQELHACGAQELLAALVRDVWMTNVSRFDATLGDTVRVIAIQSAENITKRLERLAREDDAWKATGVGISAPNNSLLLTKGDLRIHFVKAPQASRLRPNWDHDFAWEAASNVRALSAGANDAAYRVPHLEPGIAPMIPATGLGSYGAPENVNEFFVVWAGEISEQPLTAGWLVIPSLGESPVLAVEPLWRDERHVEEGSSRVDDHSTVGSASEPHVDIQLKQNIAKASNGE